MRKQEKRMAGSYEIIHAIHIGDREVVFGMDEKNKEGMKYFCGYYTRNDLFASYEDNRIGDDYLAVMQIFCERVAGQIEQARSLQEQVSVLTEPITSEQCYPCPYDVDIEGKVVAIKLSSMRPECHTADRQIYLCTGGFGAHANSRGSACFCTNLYSGKHTRWERSDILGEIRPEHLPQWASDRLAVVQAERNSPKAPIDKERG